MKSMTGFGRATGTLPDGTETTVTSRGVNHRFLDLALKLRDEYAALEIPIRKAVAAHVSRGHVDVVVRTFRPMGRTAVFDTSAAARYAMLWNEAAGHMGLPTELAAADLFTLPGVVRAEDVAEVDESSAAALLEVVARSLADLDETRKREGAALSGVLRVILGRLEEEVARLDAERGGLSERLAVTLRERIRKLAADVAVDAGRVAEEVAVLADRADISEEIERLRAHLAEISRLLDSHAPVGKRLEFLAQELHREVNTAGQKVREIGATRAVLDLKSLVESFKEQVMNVE